MAAQHLVFCAFLLLILGWLVWSTGRVIAQRERPSRSQRTLRGSRLDAAIAALTHPDPAARDTRPRPMRYWRPHWTRLGGVLRPTVTQQDE